MTIDTEIRHVTKAGANLFLELGFPAAEARKLLAASRKQINDTRALKQQLMIELANWIAEHQLKQADAAQILMVSRPRVSDVVNLKTRSSRSTRWSRCSVARASRCAWRWGEDRRCDQSPRQTQNPGHSAENQPLAGRPADRSHTRCVADASLNRIEPGMRQCNIPAPPWHCLYFLPDPQGQGSLRPTLPALRMGSWRTAAGVRPIAASARRCPRKWA